MERAQCSACFLFDLKRETAILPLVNVFEMLLRVPVELMIVQKTGAMAGGGGILFHSRWFVECKSFHFGGEAIFRRGVFVLFCFVSTTYSGRTATIRLRRSLLSKCRPLANRTSYMHVRLGLHCTTRVFPKVCFILAKKHDEPLDSQPSSERVRMFSGISAASVAAQGVAKGCASRRRAGTALFTTTWWRPDRVRSELEWTPVSTYYINAGEDLPHVVYVRRRHLFYRGTTRKRIT